MASSSGVSGRSWGSSRRSGLAADGAAYLDELAKHADEPFAITGYCMGARLGLRIAAAHPDRVAALGGFHGGGLVTDDPQSPHLLGGRAPSGALPRPRRQRRQQLARADRRARRRARRGRRHAHHRGLRGRRPRLHDVRHARLRRGRPPSATSRSPTCSTAARADRPALEPRERRVQQLRRVLRRVARVQQHHARACGRRGAPRPRSSGPPRSCSRSSARSCPG